MIAKFPLASYDTYDVSFSLEFSLKFGRRLSDERTDGLVDTSLPVKVSNYYTNDQFK